MGKVYIADLILYVNFVHLQRNNIQIIAHTFDNTRQYKNQVYIIYFLQARNCKI